jgi:midasin
LLKSSTDGPASSKIIATPTAIRTLQNIAIHLSLRLPLLLSSPPSSGKSTFIQHLAGLLHPGLHVQILTLQLSDTSLDPRSLLGSYISSPSSPGNFEWREGALVRAMKEGKWVVLADIDRATTEVLGVLGPLVGSLQSGGWIGKRAQLEVPGREVVQAHPAFALFGTRSLRTGIRMETEVPKPTFLGAHRWAEIVIDSPTPEELRAILDARVPRLAGRAVRAIANLWTAIRAVGNLASVREIGLRQLEQFCTRIDAVLPSSYRPMEMDVDSDINEHLILADVFSNPNVCENILLEARDVFFGAGAANSAAKSHLDAIAAVIGDHLRLQPDRREAVINQRMAEVRVEKDGKGKTRMVHAGRVTLTAKPTHGLVAPSTRPYAMHRPMANLIARIASAVSLSEPVLLAGETGTGKTSAISHLASMLNRPLISLNLSHQTEASDLVGGFRPMDARVPAAVIQERFLDLFGKTFPRKGNTNYQEEARKTVTTANWERAGRLWKEAARQAKVQREKTRAKATKRCVPALHTSQVNWSILTPILSRLEETLDADGPRKRRKTEEELKASQADWDSFERDVDGFCIQHVQNANKFAFAFLEGPLVKALRTGGW